MNPRLSALLLAVAVVALPMTAHASNMGFLEFSPSAFFTDKDWDIVRETANDLLNNREDGASMSWKNEENGHNGTLTVLRTSAQLGTTCRIMEVISDAVQVKTTRVVNMCKNKEGLWTVLN